MANLTQIDSLFNLNGKVALITGASRGIGKSIAETYGNAGASVVISSRNQGSLDDIAQDFDQKGITVFAKAAKIGDPTEHKNLIDAIIDRFGGLDILVNNAATNPVFGPLTDTDSGAFDKIIKVNLHGPFDLAKLAYPEMKRRGGGSIINISSVGGISPESMLGIYSVSKASLISLTKVMAKEWGADNIRTNAICPGLIKTKFSEPLWNNEQILKAAMRQQPLAQLAEPEDIVGLALLLASDAGKFSTGGVYTVDGGYTI